MAGLFDNLSEIKSLKEAVYKNIKEAIICGQLRPGDSLIEIEIARQMSISRAPIREAFNKLEQDGFVVNVPRKGCYVSPIEEKDIEELYEARLLMETFALRMTINTIPAEEIMRVELMLKAILVNPDQLDHYIAADRALHGLFQNYLTNEYIRNLMRGVDDHSMRIRYSESFDGLREEEVLMITREHMKILEALKERDTAKAIDALAEHIRMGERRTFGTIIDKDN